MLTSLITFCFIFLPYILDTRPGLTPMNAENSTICFNDTIDTFFKMLDLNTTEEINYLITQCCSQRYMNEIDEKIEQGDLFDRIFGYVLGQGFFEKKYFFYGSYYDTVVDGKIVESSESYSHYFIRLSYVMVSIVSLAIFSIAILLRLGNRIKKLLIYKIDSIRSYEFCNQVLCKWSFRTTKKAGVEYAKSSFYNYFKTTLYDMQFKQKKSKRTPAIKAYIYSKRIFMAIFTLGLYAGAGYLFWKINDLTFEQKRTTKNKYVLLGLGYVPAVTLQIIIFSYRFIFKLLKSVEEYDTTTTMTVLLMRNGLTRIASLLFLITVVFLNVNRNTNPCASQENDIDIDFDITEQPNYIWCWETYVGQELYKLIFIHLTLLLPFYLVDYILNRFFPSIYDIEVYFLELLHVQTVYWLILYFSPLLSLTSPLIFFINFYTNKVSFYFIIPF
jgi:transmembrane channel-like protein